MKLSISLLIACLLTGCSNSTDSDYTPVDIWSHKSKFGGKWSHSSTIYDAETLELADNGTFIYSDGSCTKHRYSGGRWTALCNGIILSSDSIYRTETLSGLEDSVYFNHILVAINGDTVMACNAFANKRLERE